MFSKYTVNLQNGLGEVMVLYIELEGPGAYMCKASNPDLTLGN